ncbi:MAG: hypothetical protein ABJA70_20215 [Chryseolinea sp.]
MNARTSNRSFFNASTRFLAAVFLLILLSAGFARAQNAKGDKPAPAARDNRFKKPFNRKVPKARPTSERRIHSKQPSVASRASSGGSARRASGKERPGKPVRPIFSRSPQTRQRAWNGDIAGRRIRTKSPAGEGRRNVYPQYGRYAGVQSQPKPTEHAQSNRGALARVRSISSSAPKPGRRKVVPRSGSRSFTARKSINVYANFARPKRRGERATTGDLAGRPLRRKNFETPRPGVVAPKFTPWHHSGGSPDKAYGGSMPSGYKSATRRGQIPWLGDVTGRRQKERSSKKSVEGKPLRAFGNNRSASRSHVGEHPIYPRVPGIGASGINGIKGGTRTRKPYKLGGSVSGRLWNNRQAPLQVNPPVQGAHAAFFQGNVRTRKPFKGGGSVSGRLWNNDQHPLVVNRPSQGARAGYFQGNIKRGRTLPNAHSAKGSLPRQPLPSSAGKVNGFPGKYKRFEIQPGFGYMGEADKGDIPLRIFGKSYMKHPRAAAASIRQLRLKRSAFDVNGIATKMRRPDYIRNQHSAEDALRKRGPSRSDAQAGNLQVKVRRPDYMQNKNSSENALLKPGPSNSDRLAGNLQVKIKTRGYVKNDNSADAALMKRRPSANDNLAGNLQVRIRRPDYIKNKNSAEESLMKLRPSRNDALAGNLQTKVKQPAYGRKPHAVEGSLPGFNPSSSTVRASEYARGVKRNWDYVRNPSSSEAALKVREPGKAFAKMTAYQGNIKMHKYELFERNRALHPDSKFVKTGKNNVDGERDPLTNFKLWWSRLFKKEETQPEGLKYKGRKPRYDKGEAGLWYD